MITIAAADVSANRTVLHAEGRLFFNKLHKTASGKYRGIIPTGLILDSPTYIKLPCTVSGNTVTILETEVEPTTNALIGNDARCTFAIFDSDTNRLLNVVLSDARIPTSPSSTSWPQLMAYNSGISITPPATPNAPVATDVSFSAVDVAFTLPSGASSMKILRSTGGGAFTQIAAGITSSPYHDTGLSPDTDYAYKVVATNFGGDSAQSVASNTVTTPDAPPVPDLLHLKSSDLSLSDGAAVGTWTAAVGTSPTQSTTADKPTFKTAQLGSHAAVVFDGINDTLGFTELTTIRTVIGLVRHDLDGLNSFMPQILGHSTGQDFIGWEGTEMLDRTGNSASKVLGGDAWVNTIEINPNIAPKSVAGYSVVAFKTSANATADNLASDRVANFFKGGVVELQVFSTALTDAQIITGSQALMDTYGLSVQPLVVLDGDSITASARQSGGTGWWHGAIQGTDTWGAQLVPLLTSSDFGEFELVNVAKGGQLSSDLLTDESTEVSPLFTATRPKKCACVLIGTNDVLGGIAAATTYGHIKTYCAALKAAGAEKVIIGTVPPNGSNETIRTALNALILGGDTSYDEMADLAGDIRLSDNTDTVYFQGDGIHMTLSGEAVIAELFAAEIYAAYGITPPVPPAPSRAIWLKADAITGHVNGDTLTTIPDSSGNSNDAVVSNGDNPTLYETSVLNGLPCIRLNVPFSIGQTRSYFDYPSVGHKTVFIVAKAHFSAFPDYTGLINGLDTSGVNSGFVVTGQPSSTQLGWGAGNAFAAAYRNGHAIPFVSGGHDFSPIDSAWIGSFIVPSLQTEAGRVGYALAGGRQFEGDIFEIIVFPTLLTAAQRHVVEAELGAKYSISMSVE